MCIRDRAGPAVAELHIEGYHTAVEELVEEEINALREERNDPKLEKANPTGTSITKE